MLRILKGKEIEISEGADYTKRKRSFLAFVYFVVNEGDVVYIGSTINPHTREMNHRKMMADKGFSNYEITFVGPFENALAQKIEAHEIFIRVEGGEKLYNRLINSKYNDKKFSIKNFKRKGISLTIEGSKRKKVVCEYLNQ